MNNEKIQETLGLHAGSYDAYFICDPGFRSRTPGNSNHKECRDDQYRTYVSQLENCKQCRWIQTANLQL